MLKRILELENKKAKLYYGTLFDCESNCEKCDENNLNEHRIVLLKDNHKKYYKYIRNGTEVKNGALCLSYKYGINTFNFYLENNTLEISFLDQCYTYVF